MNCIGIYHRDGKGNSVKERVELREIKITPSFTKYANGSVLIEAGNTKIICTCSVEHKVPFFLRNTGKGWLSAEYSMLPSATQQRKTRDSTRGKIDGRSQEIQRLIGRALRSAVDLDLLGEKTLWIDCDVIQADGGTRTASITGAYVALALALKDLWNRKQLTQFPLRRYLSAISLGIVRGEYHLDLDYQHDSVADVDMNFVMNDKKEMIEIQATAERMAFKKSDLDQLYEMAEAACLSIMETQKEILGEELCTLIETGKPPVKEKKELALADYLSEGRLELVLATSNPHKVEEMQRLLGQETIRILSLDEVGLGGLEIEENGKSFEENALIKAVEVCNRTGKIAVSDDSGLEVYALDFAPGIYSARFAGEPADDEKNNDKLLHMLEDVKEAERGARFVSVIAVALPNGEKKCYKGICKGRIAFERKGTNGFGYDPLFLVEEGEITYAQMDSEEKNRVSHRSRALRLLRKDWESILKKVKSEKAE